MCKKSTAILDQVILVKIDAAIYGARKKLRMEDLVLADGSRLPPEDLASLGSKKLLDPDKLAVFNRLKKEAERACLNHGTRFMGGFCIPKPMADSVVDSLARIQESFLAAKEEFVTNYEDWVREWSIRHPDFKEIILNSVDDAGYVNSRLSFDFFVVTVSPPENLSQANRERLDRQVDSLSDSLFGEIAQESKLLIERSLLGKNEVTRNVLRPFIRIRDKLDGLGFLDRRVQPVVETIDRMLTRCPKRGPIVDPYLSELMSHAWLLSDPDKTKMHGAGLLAVDPANAPDLGSQEEGADDGVDGVDGVGDDSMTVDLPELESAPELPDPVAIKPVTVAEPAPVAPAIQGQDGIDLDGFCPAAAVAKVVKDLGKSSLLDIFGDIEDELLDDEQAVEPTAELAMPTVQTAQPETTELAVLTAVQMPVASPSPQHPSANRQEEEEPADLWI
jgi:hypothetical protein